MAADQEYVDSWLAAKAAKEQAYLEGLASGTPTRLPFTDQAYVDSWLRGMANPDTTDFSQTIGGLPFMGLNRPETFLEDKPNEYNFPRITPELRITRSSFKRQANLQSPTEQLRNEYDRLEDQATYYANLEEQTQDPVISDFAHDIRNIIFKYMDEIELELTTRSRVRREGRTQLNQILRFGNGLAYKGKKHGFIRKNVALK